MGEVNHIYIAPDGDGVYGLVKFRVNETSGQVHEFKDLEEAVRYAEANDVASLHVVFPDGDMHRIPINAVL